MRQHIYAYTWRNGRVAFGKTLPEGALLIAKNFEKPLRRDVEIACRLAYDNKTLLVPGIPEAENDDQALEALIKFRSWIKQRRERRIQRLKERRAA